MRRTVTLVRQSQQPTHAPDVCLYPVILLPFHHLWCRVHVGTTICVENFRFLYVSSKTKVCQKGDTFMLPCYYIFQLCKFQLEEGVSGPPN